MAHSLSVMTHHRPDMIEKCLNGHKITSAIYRIQRDTTVTVDVLMHFCPNSRFVMKMFSIDNQNCNAVLTVIAVCLYNNLADITQTLKVTDRYDRLLF